VAKKKSAAKPREAQHQFHLDLAKRVIEDAAKSLDKGEYEKFLDELAAEADARAEALDHDDDDNED
jgi:hypothetical protein